MTTKIGPDGQYILGGPQRPEDKGGLNAGMRINKNKRLILLNFGTMVDWVALPGTEALNHAQRIRERMHETFGILPYSLDSFPFKIVANKQKGIVEWFMPQPIEVLVANPELFLALADRLEEEARKIVQ